MALVLLADSFEVAPQIVRHPRWQESDAVAISLSRTNDDLVGAEIDILDPKSAALQKAEPGAVEKERHQAGCAAQAGQDGADLVACQDDRQARRPPSAHDAIEPGEVDLEDVAVQEQERGVHLIEKARLQCRFVAAGGFRHPRKKG